MLWGNGSSDKLQSANTVHTPSFRMGLRTHTVDHKMLKGFRRSSDRTKGDRFWPIRFTC